jgi:tRNA(fMet)-specific endonuclease VapC
MACLDTCALIDIMGRRGGKHRGKVEACLERLTSEGETLTTTIFSLAELYTGIERSTDAVEEERRVLAVLTPLGVLDFDARAARLFGRVTAQLATHGTPCGDMDVLIASVAMTHGEPLVTRNAPHFDRLPGLRVISY